MERFSPYLILSNFLSLLFHKILWRPVLYIKIKIIALQLNIF